jgi:LPS sulfotransferase NodH
MSVARVGAIVGNQRSGTTAVGRLLGAQPGVIYAGEIFHNVRGPQDEPEFEKYMTLPEANFFAFKERFVGRFPSLVYPSARNQAAIWTGYLGHLASLDRDALWIVDIKYNSMHHLEPVWSQPFAKPHLLDLLSKASVPILHVVRDDVFAQAISGLRASRERRWHAAAGEASAPDAGGPVRYEPQQVAQQMQRNTRLRSHFVGLLDGYRPLLQATYEQMFLDGDLRPKARADFAALFGLAGPLQGPIDLQKIAPAALRQEIANVPGLLAHFADGPFAELVRKHLAG